MSQENLSVVTGCPGQLKLEKRPVPEVNPGEVLIKMNSVAICATDVQLWQFGKLADYVIKKPLVLGHEGSGTVTKVGCGVTNVKTGDKVAIEPSVPRDIDEFVKSGRYNLSPTIYFGSFPPDDGIMCRFVVHKNDYVYKLSDCVSLEEAALAEPLSVAIHACRRGRVKLGCKVFIAGAGPIGLCCLLIAKAMGASQILLCDYNCERLEKAKQMGASAIIKVEKTLTCPIELAQKVKQALGCTGTEVTIDCTGAEFCVQAGIYATRAGGTVVLVGIGPATMNIPVATLTMRELDIRGVLRYTNTWPMALAMMGTKKVDVKPLITHRFPLEQATEGFEMSKRQTGLKVILQCETTQCQQQQQPQQQQSPCQQQTACSAPVQQCPAQSCQAATTVSPCQQSCQKTD